VNPTSEDRKQPAQQKLDTLMAALLAETEYFRPHLRTSDPLPSELRAAELMASYTAPGGVGATTFLQALLELAERHREQHVAAMVAAVGSLLPGQITVTMVTDLVRGGLLMPSWYRRLGLAKPLRAWRHRDVFGDQELVLVTFGYGDVEHGIVVETVHCPGPRVLAVQITTDPERTRASLRESTDATGARREPVEISLEAAREALSMAIRKPYRDADDADLVLLPVIRNRVSRLPETVPPWAREAEHDHDHADHHHAEHDHDRDGRHEPVSIEARITGTWWEPPARSSREQREAAVEDFLAQTKPPAGLEVEVLRFWARVLAGYTGLTGAAPTRIGPVWLEHALADHVPTVFELTPQQRAGLRQAVTAWARWAASRQDIPPAAVEFLTEHIARLDAAFDSIYAGPDLLPLRCYLSDVARSTADGEDLLRVQRLRTLAVPPPYRRSEPARGLLGSDPDQRRLIHTDRLRTSQAPAGTPPQQWLDAVTLVSDRLWNDDPPGLAEAVTAQLDLLERLDKHEHIIDFESMEAPSALLDRLAELALEHAGDAEGFLASVRTRDWSGARSSVGKAEAVD
jgi:hypothetical protein